MIICIIVLTITTVFFIIGDKILKKKSNLFSVFYHLQYTNRNLAVILCLQFYAAVFRVDQSACRASKNVPREASEITEYDCIIVINFSMKLPG